MEVGPSCPRGSAIILIANPARSTARTTTAAAALNHFAAANNPLPEDAVWAASGSSGSGSVVGSVKRFPQAAQKAGKPASSAVKRVLLPHPGQRALYRMVTERQCRVRHARVHAPVG